VSRLPEGWRIANLGDISNIIMGQSPKSECYNEKKEGYPLIQGNADCKNRKTVPRIYTSELIKECHKGDIIMTVRAPVGAISKSYHNACIGRGVCAIRPKENEEYLYQYLIYFESQWEKLSQGTTFTAVSGSDIKNLKIPLPPLKEQKKIAEILSTVDKKIAFVDKSIEETQTLKKGLMQKLLTEGIGHTEFKESELGMIPMEWEVVKLGDICDKIQDGNYGASYPKNSEFMEKGIPFLTSKALGNSGKINYNKIDFISIEKHNELKKAHLKLNDILFTNRGANVGTIGFVDSSIAHGNIGPQLTLLRASKNIYFMYLLYSMSSNIVQKQINKNDSGSAMNFFGIKETSKFMFPLPSLEEQKQIAKILSTVDEKLEILREKKKSYERLKKGLMQKLLTGEVRR
jgi:type I restriction enzyme S subunit